METHYAIIFAGRIMKAGFSISGANELSLVCETEFCTLPIPIYTYGRYICNVFTRPYLFDGDSVHHLEFEWVAIVARCRRRYVSIDAAVSRSSYSAVSIKWRQLRSQPRPAVTEGAGAAAGMGKMSIPPRPTDGRLGLRRPTFTRASEKASLCAGAERTNGFIRSDAGRGGGGGVAGAKKKINE